MEGARLAKNEDATDKVKRASRCAARASHSYRGPAADRPRRAVHTWSNHIKRFLLVARQNYAEIGRQERCEPTPANVADPEQPEARHQEQVRPQDVLPGSLAQDWTLSHAQNHRQQIQHGKHRARA